MQNLEVELSTIKLDSGKHTLRIPPRKEEQQQHNYKSHFDFNTLLADIFQRDTGVELIGPPLLNLEELFNKSIIKIDGIEYDKNHMKIESIYRKCRILLPKVHDGKKIEIEYEGEVFSRDIQPNHYEVFQSSNVLVTQQRDNPLEWIGYWVSYHIKHHNIDSVIIYDNNSSLYTTIELRALLSKIKGLKSFCVVDWDIPYGAVGGEYQIWDSDFGQYQSWEHAYSRFLLKANSVLICDIDELVLHEDGAAIPDILESIEEPVITFKKRQIAEIASYPEYKHLPRMHCLTHLYEDNKPLYAPKYAFMPSKVSPDIHLLVHNVIGDKMFTSEKLLGRHFGALRIHWRNDNFSPIPLLTLEEYENRYKKVLIEDKQLKSSFEGVDLDWLE